MSGAEQQPRWSLTLYVSGASPRSSAAVESVRALCDNELARQVDLTVVDVREQPALAIADRVLAVPTLVKRLPEPLRRLVGDLGSTERLWLGLDLGPAPAAEREDGGEPA